MTRRMRSGVIAKGGSSLTKLAIALESGFCVKRMEGSEFWEVAMNYSYRRKLSEHVV